MRRFNWYQGWRDLRSHRITPRTYVVVDDFHWIGYGYVVLPR